VCVLDLSIYCYLPQDHSPGAGCGGPQCLRFFFVEIPGRKPWKEMGKSWEDHGKSLIDPINGGFQVGMM
jgi:hypothetical protein